MSVLIVLYLILFIVLAKIRLDWAILFLIFSLPSYLIRFKILGIPFTLLEAMIISSSFVWFSKNYKNILENLKIKLKLKLANNNQKLLNYPFGVEASLLLVISFLAVAVSGFSDNALGIWKAYFFEPILFFILVINVFQKKEKNILWALLFSAFFVSFLAVWQKFTGLFIFNDFWAAEETRRAVSFFGYPNAVGLYLGPLILLFFGWLSHVMMSEKNERIIFKQFFNSKIFKIIFVSLNIVLALLAIYCAKSEGALIGVIVGLMVFGILVGGKARWVTIIMVIVFTVGIMSYQPMRSYAIQKITLQDLSGQIRLQQWRETWQMLNNGKIMTGAGLANYQAQVAPYHQEGIFFNRDNDPDFHRKTVFNEEYRKKYWQPVETYLYPHNIFLNFWSELGLAGLLLFVWIIGKYFLITHRITRNLPTGQAGAYHEKYLVLGLVGAMVVIVVHGLVDVPYFKNDLAVMFWILMAMFSLINIEKNYKV